MKNIKMLVFDVDGTLYDLVEHCIPTSCIKAIKQAKENGYIFVIATGRAHYGLGKALHDLQPDYILSASGGVVVDKDGKVISYHDISAQAVHELLDFCHKEEAGLVFKFLDHMYIYQHAEKIDWLKGQMESDIGKAPFIFHEEQTRHLQDLPQSASVHADPKMVKEVFQDHKEIAFLQYSKDGYDVVPQGVHKGIGLQELMDYLHLTKEEVACFGDNYNDLEMMDVAGWRIAMGNAIDELKEKADYVTTASHEDGIYLALQHLHCID